MCANTPTIRLYVMCGLPGSGKSTWAAQHMPFVRYVSRDDIRFGYLQPEDDYFKYEDKVWHDFMTRIANYANSGQDVLIDATHINLRSRAKLYRALEAWLNVDYEIHLIFMDTCLSKCIRQNETREGLRKVPESAIRNMFHSLEVPFIGEGNNARVKSLWVVRI